MADDVAITPGIGATIAADFVAGVYYQRAKIVWGADGVANDANAATPLPVVQTGTPALPGLGTTADLSVVAINCAASGDNTIVAGSGALVVRVYGFFFFVAGAVSVKWRSNATDFHPALPLLGSGAAWGLDRDGRPHFTCVAGEALKLNLSAAIQTSGYLWYTQV